MLLSYRNRSVVFLTIVFVVLGLLLWLVLVNANEVGAQGAPNVDVQVGVSRTQALITVQLAGFTPGAALYRTVSSDEWSCAGQQTINWTNVFVGYVAQDDSFADTYATVACHGSYTFSYADSLGWNAFDVVNFDRSLLVFRTDCVGPAPEPRWGYTVELTTNVLQAFPHDPGDGYRNVTRDFPVGTQALVLFGLACGDDGLYQWYVRTLPSDLRYDQLGWVDQTQMINWVPGVEPATPPVLSSTYPEAQVIEGGLRVNMRTLPTVRQVDGAYVGAVLNQVRPGETVRVLGMTANHLWFKVQNQLGQQGWVCSNLLPYTNFDSNWLPNNHPDGLLLSPVPMIDVGFAQEDCFGNSSH